MTSKSKAQLLAEIKALQKRLAEPQTAENETPQKISIFKKPAHTLGERVKELDCLYGISGLVETPGISLDEILQGSVELLPSAWQYPQITCARITLGDREYKTGNFHESKWKLASEIKVEGKRSGSVEVYYLEEQPKEYEGPFLKEERALIDVVTERLGRIIQRVQVQERVEHLTLVLRAIRNVNQLIIREKNPDVLIQKICDTLTETRGYSTAWIMLLDERGEYLDSAESGLGKSFTSLLKELKRDDFPACVQQAQAQPGPMEINDPSSTCADCPITDTYSDKGRMTIRLEHAEKVYGVLSVSFGVDLAVDEEELSLFEEVAGDIGFALHNFKLDEKGMQVEQSLRDSEKQYRILFNSMLNGFALHEMIYDDAGRPIDYRFIEVNPAFEKLTGLRAGDIIGKTALDVLPKLESIWIENYSKIALTGEPMRFEQYAQELNKHHEVIAFSPKKNQFATVISDITERKAFTQELQQERDKAQKYLDIAEVMIVALNKEGEITLVNQKGASILGYQIEELTGKNWFDTCVPTADKKQAKNKFNEFIDGEEGWGGHFEQTVITKSGKERIIDWHSTPLWEWGDEDKHRIGSLSSGEDITERVQAHEKEQRFFQSNAFLSKTAIRFVDFPTQEDIYRFISEKLKELAGESIVVVNSIDQAKNILTTRAVAGMEKYAKDTLKLLGRNPVGIEHNASHENLAYLTDGELHDERESLYELFLRSIPKPVCRALEKLYRLNKIYTIGFVKNKILFGTLAIQLSKGHELKNKETIKLFIEQASIAIQKRQAAQSLRDSEQQYRILFNSMLNGFALHEMIYDDAGKPIDFRFIEVNPAFEKLTGLRAADIIGKTALEVYPEPEIQLIENYGKVALTGESINYEQHAQRINRHFEVFVFSPKKNQFAIVFSDITERVRNEKKLIKSERNYKEAESLAHIGHWDNEPIEGKVSWSDEVYSIFGTENDGQSLSMDAFLNRIHPEDREAIRAQIESGESHRSNYRIIMADGSIKHLHEEVLIERHKDGKIKTMRGTVQDITERVQAQKAIQKEQKKAQQYLDIAGVALVALNTKGEITLINQKGCQILGHQEDKLIGRNWFVTCLPERNIKEVKGVFRKIIKGEVDLVEYYENPILTKSGEERIIAWHNTLLSDEKGNNIGTLASGEDITERVQAQKAIQKEQKKAQQYLDVAGVVFVALNKKGEITLINQKGCQTLDYQEDELIGRNWFDTCLPEKNRKEVKQEFKQIIAGEIESFECNEGLIVTKSGEERIIAWHDTVLWDEKEHIIGLLSSGEDITERVRAEQLLNALNQAAVAMGAVQTHQEIFHAVAEELKQLDISCMLFPLNEMQSRLFTEYLSYESKALNTVEKLVGIKHEDFSFPVDKVDMYREVIKKKKTVFSNNSGENMRKILPKLAKKLTAQIIKLLHLQKSISAPLIVEDQAVGVFSIQSDTLVREDIPAATAFADQLSSAWNKIGLLQNLRKTVEGTIHTIAATVEARDPYTAGHQTRVADLAASIAREMKLTSEQIEGIRMAGIVHDLGKINIPAEILSKPGKISELEYKIIQTHPQVGFDLLKEIEFPWPIAEMVLQHHEKIDGSGYPAGA